MQYRKQKKDRIAIDVGDTKNAALYFDYVVPLLPDKEGEEDIFRIMTGAKVSIESLFDEALDARAGQDSRAIEMTAKRLVSAVFEGKGVAPHPTVYKRIVPPKLGSNETGAVGWPLYGLYLLWVDLLVLH